MPGDDQLAAFSRQQADAQRLMATGLIGQATVASLRDTGMTINDNPQIEFALLVTVDGREAVSGHPSPGRLAARAGQLPSQGASIPVRVDPADPAGS